MSDQEKEALSKPEDIPVQIAKLQTYGNSLTPRLKGGDMYYKLRIGYDGDPHDFLMNLTLEWKARGRFVKKEGLQQAYPVNLAIITYTIKDFNGETLMSFLNDFTTNKVANWGKPPVVFGYEFKMIFDGANDAVRKKQMDKQRNLLTAGYLLCSQCEIQCTCQISKVLFNSTDFSINYNVFFVPWSTALLAGRVSMVHCQFNHMVKKHKHYGHSLTQYTRGMDHFINLDKPLSLLEGNPMTHMLVMQMKNKKGKNLFLSMELQHWGWQRSVQSSVRSRQQRGSQISMELSPKILQETLWPKLTCQFHPRGHWWSRCPWLGWRTWLPNYPHQPWTCQTAQRWCKRHEQGWHQPL